MSEKAAIALAAAVPAATHPHQKHAPQTKRRIRSIQKVRKILPQPKLSAHLKHCNKRYDVKNFNKN
jgi:hypothetical protein